MKRSGLGHAMYVNGVDLSSGIQSIATIGGGFAPVDMTAINQLAMDRLGGIRDGRMEVASFLDASAGSAHVTLSALPQTDEVLSYCAGTSLGDPVACIVAKQATYDSTRSQDGSVLFNTSALGNGFGLEWCELLTAGTRIDTTATTGTAVDFGATTNFGLQAFLHVTAFTGTSATIKIQESADNGVGDTWADVVGGAFLSVNTAPMAQRLQTSRLLAVERYLRVVTTGTFSNLRFMVAVAKNVVAVDFDA